MVQWRGCQPVVSSKRCLPGDTASGHPVSSPASFSQDSRKTHRQEQMGDQARKARLPAPARVPGQARPAEAGKPGPARRLQRHEK